MLPIVLSSITGADVCSLVPRVARESRRLDFKRDLYKIYDTDKAVKSDERRELIADVVAFANAEGGDLVIGVDEENEVAIAADGVDAKDAVTFEKELTNLWLSAIDPALKSVESTVVPHPEEASKAFVIVRIRPSLNAPHRTRAERIFYERIGRQKMPLEMPQIREAFLRQDIYVDRFEAFRQERHRRIAVDNHHGHPWVLIHIAPLHALARGSRQLLDFKVLDPKNNMNNLAQVDVEYFTSAGFFRMAYANEEIGSQGFHVFYDGRYEQMIGGLLDRGQRVLRLRWLMLGLVKCLQHARRIEDQLGHGPVLVALTASDISGSVLELNPTRGSRPSKQPPEDAVWCPEVRLESLPEKAHEFARAIAPSLLPLFLSYNFDSVKLPIDEHTWTAIEDECET